MTVRPYERLLEAAEAEVQKGRSVILDATFARHQHRQWLAERFGKNGIAWRLLEAQANNATIRQRRRGREGAPSEVSDARLEDFSTLTGLFEPPSELLGGQRVRVRTSGPLHQTVTRALQSLARLGADGC